jgi:hypothetical protein
MRTSVKAMLISLAAGCVLAITPATAHANAPLTCGAWKKISSSYNIHHRTCIERNGTVSRPRTEVYNGTSGPIWWKTNLYLDGDGIGEDRVGSTWCNINYGWQKLDTGLYASCIDSWRSYAGWIYGPPNPPTRGISDVYIYGVSSYTWSLSPLVS